MKYTMIAQACVLLFLGHINLLHGSHTHDSNNAHALTHNVPTYREDGSSLETGECCGTMYYKGFDGTIYQGKLPAHQISFLETTEQGGTIPISDPREQLRFLAHYYNYHASNKDSALRHTYRPACDILKNLHVESPVKQEHKTVIVLPEEKLAWIKREEHLYYQFLPAILRKVLQEARKIAVLPPAHKE